MNKYQRTRRVTVNVDFRHNLDLSKLGNAPYTAQEKEAVNEFYHDRLRYGIGYGHLMKLPNQSHKLAKRNGPTGGMFSISLFANNDISQKIRGYRKKASQYKARSNKPSIDWNKALGG
jgi:hypothetical protein